MTAQSPLLEMGSASAGQVIDEKRISMMPLSDGNPFVLSRLVPGVAFTGDLKFSRPFDNAGTSGINADGASGGNEFTLDGSPNMTSGRRVAFVPPAGAVQQFKVGTATFDAGDGHTAGAVVNVDAQERHQQPEGRGLLLPAPRRAVGHRLLRQQDRRREAGPEVQPAGRLPRRAAALEPHLLLRRGGVALRHVPRAAAADGADAGDAQRRLLGAAGAGDDHLRSGHRHPGRRPRRAAAVSREHHPGESHQPDRGRRAEVLSAAESGGGQSGAEQLLLRQSPRRHVLLDVDARRSPADRQAAAVRALHAQRSPRVPQRHLRRGQRDHPERQLPVPDQRRRHLRSRLHDDVEHAARRARRVAALQGAERPAARRDLRSGDARVLVSGGRPVRRREILSALRLRSVLGPRREPRRRSPTTPSTRSSRPSRAFSAVIRCGPATTAVSTGSSARIPARRPANTCFATPTRSRASRTTPRARSDRISRRSCSASRPPARSTSTRRA